MVAGKGQNQLGRLLDQIRTDIQNNEDLEKWLLMSFRLEKNIQLLPYIRLDVIKDDAKLDPIWLEQKANYFFGQQKKNDVLLAHPSISRRHAVIFLNDHFQVSIMDLGSRSGTFLNDQFLEPHIPYALQNDDYLKFAKSSRTYVLDIDFSRTKEFILRKIKNLERDVRLLEKIQQGKASHEELKASLGLTLNDTVMAKNLPQKTSHFELQQMFSKYGKIKELKIPIDKVTSPPPIPSSKQATPTTWPSSSTKTKKTQSSSSPKN